jgi:cyclophilin family peptidyl-prolyl cis-trans isomerase
VKRHTNFLLSCLAAALVTAGQAQTSPSNSVVRFRISHGSQSLATIDVELFDSDKPVTVSNFLYYAQSGAYDHTFMQRVIPNFVLQGGEYTIANPFSPSPFEIAVRVPTGPAITNEFQVGTLRSNVFGTLAMAKVPGDPNSATSSWFFNLSDNSTNLDTQNGGFTVFGKVKTGLNALSFFNTLGQNYGIIDMTSDLYVFFCAPLRRYPDNARIGFPELPVAFTGFDCVHYSDLLTVEITVLKGPDVVPPKVTIKSPAINHSVTNENVIVSGIASDNANVAVVRAYLNTNAPVTATGSNSWSAVLTNVPPGTNLVIVEAIDTSGNRSQAGTLFFRSVRVPLTLQIVGAGSVSGAADDQLLELTRGYALVAKPNPGNLFAGWTGTLNSASTTIRFLMESNTSLTALFVTNLFPFVKGTYNGLFYDTNQVDQQSAGFLTLSVGDFGGYTAKLLMNGKKYGFKGSFGVDGALATLVDRPGTNSLLLQMALDLTGGSDRLTGSVTNNQLVFIDTNRSWSATLIADRAVFNSKTNSAPQAGKYTWILPADTNSSAGPAGDGFGSAKVDANGLGSLTGTLADGTKAALKAPLSKNGWWPLYIPLYKDKGALVSWVTFDTNQPTTDFSGSLDWFKQSQPKAKYYPGGFTNEVLLAGSLYAPPTTNRVLSLTNGIVGFTNGNLLEPFTNEIALGLDNKVVNNSTNKLTLTIGKPTGLFTGTAVPPRRTKPISFKGAILQKQERGSGFFLGTNASGRVSLAPR